MAGWVLRMISFTQGNLLQCRAEALVNTVNTVGVMGKGIALMFKEAFPAKLKAYAAACKDKLIKVGTMYVTERKDLVDGPRWIINFPTKQHWRQPSKLQWIEELRDLRRVIAAHQIKSICNSATGKRQWCSSWGEVRPLIEKELGVSATMLRSLCSSRPINTRMLPSDPVLKNSFQHARWSRRLCEHTGSLGSSVRCLRDPEACIFTRSRYFAPCSARRP